jgi:hypothetical protein
MKDEMWIDCTICDHFRLEKGRQTCLLFEVVGLPDLFHEGAIKKSCSSFSAPKNLNSPDLTQMSYGVLYFYNPKTPDKIQEDIDL